MSQRPIKRVQTGQVGLLPIQAEEQKRKVEVQVRGGGKVTESQGQSDCMCCRRESQLPAANTTPGHLVQGLGSPATQTCPQENTSRVQAQLPQFKCLIGK